MAELGDLGQLSEQLGYRYFWYVDTRFKPECYLGLAAVAARTSSIMLGTGVTDPFSRHPAITTVSIATLDEMSGGRAVLGLGAGGATLRQLGIDWKLPVAALRESVDVIRRLLLGEEVTLEGKVISLERGKLQYQPLRPEIPIYFATHGAQVTKLAGEVADGILLANTVAPDELAPFLERIGEGLAVSGRPRSAFDLCVRLEIALDDDEEAAFMVMKNRVVTKLINEYPKWDYLAKRGITLPAAFEEAAAQKQPVSAAATLFPNEVVGSLTLAGNAERIAQQISAVIRPEVTQICVRPYVTRGQNVASVIEKFAKEVMPRAVQLAEAAPVAG